MFKRVLLKISGELLKDNDSAVAHSRLAFLAEEIRSAVAMGVEIGVVIGAGNIIRGASFAEGLNRKLRAMADIAGMTATAVNALALAVELEYRNVPCEVFSAVEISGFAKTFSLKQANQALSEGKVALFATGLGHPFFTTDTAAAIRAAEINADALLKATKVDGVYNKDPNKFADAKRFDKLKMSEAISQNLRIMDQTAFAVCRETGVPIVVFKLAEPGDLALVLSGEGRFTFVEPDAED